MTLRQASKQAETKSRVDGGSWHAVAVDHNDGRTFLAVPDSYVNQDEFQAFDGVVYASFYNGLLDD